jgi:hypothetical protein
MKLEDIQQMWSVDSEIDSNNLDGASIQSAKLHSKYLDLFNAKRMKMKLKEHQLKILKHHKWKYYSGKMTKEEIDRFEWPYDPWDGGNKPMKSEINSYIEADPDVAELQLQIEYLKIAAMTIEEILNNIRWRHSNIKNVIEWRKFMAGT